MSGRLRWVEPAAFTKVSALGVEEQRVNVVIDTTAPAAQWQSLGDGFKVDVRVLVQVVDKAVMGPAGALFPIGSRSGIFVLEGGHANLKEVSVEARNEVSAWVKTGLTVGAQVVVYPDKQAQRQDGRKGAVNTVQSKNCDAAEVAKHGWPTLGCEQIELPASSRRWATPIGRVQVATNGSFTEAEPQRSRSMRRAALEEPDGRVWVESPSSPSAGAVFGRTPSPTR